MPTYTLRPNANWIGATNYTVTGTTYAYTALSDNSDSTYIQKTLSTEGASSIELEFGTSTIPANERIATVNFRVRADRATATTTGALSIVMGYIKNRNSKTAKYSAATIVTPTSTTTTFDTGINLTLDPDGDEWTQQAIDDLLIRITDTAGSTSRSKIYEVYCDVVTTTQPTVTVTAPSGSITTTSFPPINWTYTDTEGDTQAAYQVKIFDAATYGAGSFDPETSTPTVNTGIVNAPDAGAALTVDLANSTSYRAYVKAAQLVNGVLYWSAWAYSSFSTSLDAPGIPALAASYDTVENGVLVAVRGTTNMLNANAASIEVDATGWSADSNCSVARSTLQAAIGSASLLVSATATGDMTTKTGSAYDVTPNVSYAALCSVRSNSVARSAKVGIRWFNSSGTAISTTYGTPANDATGSWTVLTVTGTSPAAAVTARVVVTWASAASTEGHFVDKISLHPGVTATWTVGGFSNFVFDVQKSIDNGANWTEIRNSPVTADEYQGANVYDYEIPVGTFLYRAKARGDI